MPPVIVPPNNSSKSGSRMWGGKPSLSVAAQDLYKYQIIDMETDDKFVFHAMPEGGYSISKSARWADTDIIGRSSPIKGYSGSDAASFSLRIPLFSSIEQGDDRTPYDVRDGVRFFLSLTYPDYKNGIKPPHRCILFMAEQFYAIVVPMSCSIDFPGPWDKASGLSFRAIVDISFQEVDDIPKDLNDVRGGVFS